MSGNESHFMAAEAELVHYVLYVASLHVDNSIAGLENGREANSIEERPTYESLGL
jgi:hypothetical protein